MSENKFEQAVFRIFELTHLGQLTWSKRDVPAGLRRGTENVISRYFEASYQGRQLALYSERFHVQSPDEKRQTWLFFDSLNARLQPGWHERDVLALLGDDGEVAFKFPTIRETHALMEAVCLKASNVDQFVDVLLNTEPSKA